MVTCIKKKKVQGGSGRKLRELSASSPKVDVHVRVRLCWAGTRTEDGREGGSKPAMNSDGSRVLSGTF